jgi:fructose-1,6-bisphosphatase/sedoheptulose 1,7-bisphosphatase-like protein
VEAKQNNQVRRLMSRWQRYELIAVDEVGYVPLADIGAEFLFQVISERAERAAIIVTTNLPFSEWTTVFPNPRLCKALLDRITDRALRLIPDGDLSAGIAAAVRGAGVDAVFGTGGAPEGVITAAALRCLSGEMVARLVVNTPELEARVEKMGIRDPKRVYSARDLAPGEQIVFAAAGVTEGALLQGVRFFGDGCRTHTLIMTYASRKVRFVDTVHMFRDPGRRGVRLY